MRLIAADFTTAALATTARGRAPDHQELGDDFSVLDAIMDMLHCEGLCLLEPDGGFPVCCAFFSTCARLYAYRPEAQLLCCLLKRWRERDGGELIKANENGAEFSTGGSSETPRVRRRTMEVLGQLARTHIGAACRTSLQRLLTTYEHVRGAGGLSKKEKRMALARKGKGAFRYDVPASTGVSRAEPRSRMTNVPTLCRYGSEVSAALEVDEALKVSTLAGGNVFKTKAGRPVTQVVVSERGQRTDISAACAERLRRIVGHDPSVQVIQCDHRQEPQAPELEVTAADFVVLLSRAPAGKGGRRRRRVCQGTELRPEHTFTCRAMPYLAR